MQVDKDFVVNSDGSVTSLTGAVSVKKTSEDQLEAEYNQLVYDMSHPERFTPDEMAAKSERHAELHKALGKDKFMTTKGGKMMDAAARMREKLREQLKQKQMAQNVADIAAQQKQNG